MAMTLTTLTDRRPPPPTHFPTRCSRRIPRTTTPPAPVWRRFRIEPAAAARAAAAETGVRGARGAGRLRRPRGGFILSRRKNCRARPCPIRFCCRRWATCARAGSEWVRAPRCVRSRRRHSRCWMHRACRSVGRLNYSGFGRLGLLVSWVSLSIKVLSHQHCPV